MGMLREIRKAKGFTQQELANKAGVNIRQIQKLEAGETLVARMTVKNALALAKALDTTIEELSKLGS